MNKLRILAGLTGAAAVALGAIGAHTLREILEGANMVSTWDTAALYHLAHAIAVLAVTSSDNASGGKSPLPAKLWLTGILFFSGSLYLLALGGPRWLGPITPVGGILLIAGWIAWGWPKKTHV